MFFQSFWFQARSQPRSRGFSFQNELVFSNAGKRYVHTVSGCMRTCKYAGIYYMHERGMDVRDRELKLPSMCMMTTVYLCMCTDADAILESSCPQVPEKRTRASSNRRPCSGVGPGCRLWFGIGNVVPLAISCVIYKDLPTASGLMCFEWVSLLYFSCSFASKDRWTDSSRVLWGPQELPIIAK